MTEQRLTKLDFPARLWARVFEYIAKAQKDTHAKPVMGELKIDGNRYEVRKNTQGTAIEITLYPDATRTTWITARMQGIAEELAQLQPTVAAARASQRSKGDPDGPTDAQIGQAQKDAAVLKREQKDLAREMAERTGPVTECIMLADLLAVRTFGVVFTSVGGISAPERSSGATTAEKADTDLPVPEPRDEPAEGVPRPPAAKHAPAKHNGRK